MKIHELTVTKKKAKKRLGRGIGSGYGKTAGRGTKGQNSRTGGGVSVGFEGGQTKLSMRLPKVRGFKARNSINYQLIHTSDINTASKSSLDVAALLEAGIIKSTRKPVKLLLDIAVEKKVTIKLNAASRSAIKSVEKAGGKVEIISVKPAKSKTSKTTDKPAKTEPVKSKPKANK